MQTYCWAMDALKKNAQRAGTALLALALLLIVLFWIEASVGHDGLLCELGYDRDGAGTGITGCG
jgi:hypothetical protein